MRQVGRSVQCRQNRRGRTAATWPYSVRIKGSRNFPTSGLRCGGRDGGARENSGLARTAPHERTLSVDSPAALAEAGRGPRCHCGGGLRVLFCGDLRSRLSNPSGDRDPPGGQPIRRVVLPGHPLLCDNRRELSCGPPGWMVAGDLEPRRAQLGSVCCTVARRTGGWKFQLGHVLWAAELGVVPPRRNMRKPAVGHDYDHNDGPTSLYVRRRKERNAGCARDDFRGGRSRGQPPEIRDPESAQRTEDRTQSANEKP